MYQKPVFDIGKNGAETQIFKKSKNAREVIASPTSILYETARFLGVHYTFSVRAVALGRYHLTRRTHRSTLVKFRLRFRDRSGFHAGEMDISAMATVLSKSAKAADNLLGSKRGETLNFLHLPCTRITNFLSIPHPLT